MAGSRNQVPAIDDLRRLGLAGEEHGDGVEER